MEMFATYSWQLLKAVRTVFNLQSQKVTGSLEINKCEKMSLSKIAFNAQLQLFLHVQYLDSNWTFSGEKSSS